MKTITIDGIEYELTPVAQTEKTSGKRWRAERGGGYFTITRAGDTKRLEDLRDKYDNHLYNSGNYYKTREEAERARDKQLALVRVTDKLREIEACEGWVADWDDYKHEKYFAMYNHKTRELGAASNVYWESPVKEMYSCKNAIDYVIKHMKDDLKLIFGVE